MTVAVKLQVPKNVNYVVHVKVERYDEYHGTWAAAGRYIYGAGDEATLWLSKNIRFAMQEEPVDKVTLLPADSHRAITINEDAHGG